MTTYCTSSRPKISAISRARADCLSISRARAAGCSCSSASSHDTRLAPTEDADDLEPVVQDDDVGEAAGLEDAEIGPAENASRHGGRCAHRVLERNAECMQVANRLDHRQHGPGPYPISTNRHAVRDVDLHVAKLIRAGDAGCSR